METINFFGINIGIIAGLALLVFMYLIVLINKRRKDKFLHDQGSKDPK